jgi:hypothetical protein
MAAFHSEKYEIVIGTQSTAQTMSDFCISAKFLSNLSLWYVFARNVALLSVRAIASL